MPPGSGWPDMPSERAAYNVGYTLGRPCDGRPGDTALGPPTIGDLVRLREGKAFQ